MIAPEFFQITYAHVKEHAHLSKQDIGKWVFSLTENEFVGFVKSKKEIEDYFFGNRKTILRSRNNLKETNA